MSTGIIESVSPYAESGAPMNCQCGYEPEHKPNVSGRLDLNRHRRNCSVFWQAVSAEIGRVATVLYGKPMAVSQAEWTRYRGSDFPSWETMRDWGKSWTQVQLDSGLGVSNRGWGSLSIKGKIADDNVLWRHMEETAKAKRVAIMDDAAYTALTERDGFAICESTYRRTGRMILR